MGITQKNQFYTKGGMYEIRDQVKFDDYINGLLKAPEKDDFDWLVHKGVLVYIF